MAGAESSRPELWAVCSVQRHPRRALRRAPGRALPASARRARRGVLHPGRVEGRSPAALVIACELEVVTLVRHADRDPPDASPRVQPGAEGMEGAVIGGHRAPGEADSSTQELAALVEHGASRAPRPPALSRPAEWWARGPWPSRRR